MTEFNCSFCGIGNRQARKMISAPKAFICDECIELCVEVLGSERAEGRMVFTWESEIVEDRAAMRAESRRLKSAIANIGHAVAEVLGKQSIKCMWCQVSLDSENAAREHVAICDKHPAVAKLRELESKRKRRKAARPPSSPSLRRVPGASPRQPPPPPKPRPPAPPAHPAIPVTASPPGFGPRGAEED